MLEERNIDSFYGRENHADKEEGRELERDRNESMMEREREMNS